MAQTVYILGAGASACTGAPLMEHFVDSAADIRRDKPARTNLAAFDTVFDVLRPRLERLHSRSVADLQNIESIFGYVEMGRLIKRLPDTDIGELDGLSAALRTVLAETIQNRCLFNTEAGNWTPHTEYLRLVQGLEKRDVAFVTFNYDIALDFALYWARRPFTYSFAEPPRGTVPLLKLHGSLNWIACPRCAVLREVPLNSIFSNQGKHLGADEKHAVFIRPEMAHLGEHCQGAGVDGTPALVPPSWNKTQYWTAFGNIWARAAHELAEAEEICIVGYSMPISDTFFRELLALCLVGARHLRRFVVVNPDPNVLGRYRALLGPETIRRFDGRQ